MARNRQAGRAAIPEVPFAAPAGTPSGIEVTTLAALRERVPATRLAAPQRPEFHHLLTLTDGSLDHTVDFTVHRLDVGSWLWVRPGQVQQWGDLTGAEGTVVLFLPGALDSATATASRLDDPHAPALHRPRTAEAAALSLALHHLSREFQDLGQLPLEVHTAALRHLLAVLVLRLSHPSTARERPARPPDSAFLRFRDAVEKDFTRTRRVEDYAHALGYSARTLARACQAAAGVGAKEYIDRRVVLEAKRLLAHGDESATWISARLGFPSATHFTKYFHQRTGRTPIAFRATVRDRTPG
jgi:AraC-like DNA-binding protein